MTDLSEKLDLSERQRLIDAVRKLSAQEYRDLMISLLGGMGVRVQSAREQQNALVIHGQGEMPYLVLATRTGFSDPELVVRSLVQDAKGQGRAPVFMAIQELDPGTLNLLEREEVSFADKEKFISLLKKYGLDRPLLDKQDLKVLEERGEPCLPSVCKLEELLEEAEQRRRKGDRIGAVRVLEQALQIKPLNDSLWLKKAEHLLEMGNGEEALAAANRAAELRPGDTKTWYTIALIQNQLGDRERELAAYDNVLRINPAHAPALLNKGATLFEMGRLEWSLKVFNDLVHRYPQEPRGWNNRGLALKAMGRAVEAMASFEKAHALDPTYEDPLINIALMREERGDLASAVEGWKDVLRLVDSRADIWAHLGTCLRAIGEKEDALTAMDRALELEPSMENVRRERDELAAELEGGAPGHEGTLEGSGRPESAQEAERLEPRVPQGPVVVTGNETALQKVPEERMPAEIPDRRALQKVQDDRSLEAVPENQLPSEVPEGPLSVREEPGRLQTAPEAILPERSQSGALTAWPQATGMVPQEVEEGRGASAVEESKEWSRRRNEEDWPFPVVLDPLPEGRDERMRQEIDLLIAGKELEKAVKVIDIALREGGDLELLRLKARALLSLNRGEEAAEALKEALRHSPDDPRTILDLEALFHRYGGDGGKLLQSLDCQESLARRALDLLERQRYNELVKMDADKGGMPARLARSLALMRLGRYREASKLLKSMISEFPAYPEGLNDLGVCMRFMGEYDYDQAIHLMRLALEVDPHSSIAMNNIGCTLFAAGRYEEALEVLKAAVDEDRRPEYLLNLSNAQMAVGDVEGAKTSLTSALKMEESADALYMLGMIAEGEKDYRWALSLFQDALSKSPGFREAQAGVDRTKVLAKK